MIAVITTPHWGDLILLAVLVTLTTVLIYLGCRLVDLAINAMQRPARQDFARHADDAGRDIAPEDEPSWPGKVDPLIEPVHHNPTRYATGGPVTSSAAMVDESGCSFVVPLNGTLPETPAETSQPRHSADDTVTELFPVVVDEDETVGAS